MHKDDLVLNNLQCLIYYKTEPDQSKSYKFNIYVKEDLALNNINRFI